MKVGQNKEKSFGDCGFWICDCCASVKAQLKYWMGDFGIDAYLKVRESDNGGIIF